jgi:hypothetical protein
MVRSMVYRSLHRSQSIKTLLADMAAADIGRQAPTDAAWCQARSKLPAALWPGLSRRSTQRLVDSVGHQFLYWGRPVFLIDGSTVSMPDEPELVETFGYVNTKHGLSRLPVARLTFLVRAGVRAVCDYKISHYRTGEDAQFNQMWPRFRMELSAYLTGIYVHFTTWPNSGNAGSLLSALSIRNGIHTS